MTDGTLGRADVLLATARQGITRAEHSPDGWVTRRLLEGIRVTCLVLGPGNAVWAGTHGGGVMRSDDAGASWTPVGLEGRIVKAVAPSPQDPTLVYAGLKPPGVAVTRNRGASWIDLTGFRRIRGRRLWFSPAEPPGTAYVQGLAVSPVDPAIVVAGIEFGAVVRSEDGGQTWSGHCPGAIRDCHSLSFHATDGRRVYQGGAGWPRRPFALSRDAGRTWSSPRGGNRLGYGWAAAADAGDPETTYVSAARGPRAAHGRSPAGAMIYRSRGLAPWEALSGGLPTPLDAMPYALIPDPLRPGHLYAGLSDGSVWCTADQGDTWLRLDADLGPIERSMAIVWRSPT